MTRRRNFFFATAIAAGTAAGVYGYSLYKSMKEKEKRKKIISEGDKLFKDESYAEAINKYLVAYNNDKSNISVLKKIAQCFFKINDYESSVKYSQKVLDINRKNLESLENSYECHKILNNHLEAVKAIFICSFIDRKKYNSEKLNYFNKILTEKANERIESADVFPNSEKLIHFFETFPTIKKDYNLIPENIEKELFKIYKQQSNDNKVNFIKASIEHLKGNDEKAKEYLKKVHNLHGKVLQEFILSKTVENFKISEGFKKILEENSNEFSVVFYGAIIYSEHNFEKYNELLERGLKMENSTVFSLLKALEYLKSPIEKNTFDKIKNLIEAERRKNNSVKEILKLLIEQFISLKEFKVGKGYLEILDNFYEDDFYSFLYKGMISGMLEEKGAEEYYTKALIRNNESFEALYRYGNYLMSVNDKKFIQIFEKAFENSTSFKEAYISYQVILSYNVHTSILEKYPEFELN